MTDLTLDIETMPNEISEALANELYGKIEPTKTAIKAGTEAEYIQSKKDEIAEDFALSPMTGKILGIGMLLPETDMATYIEDTEIEMLKYLGDLFAKGVGKIITFNGKGFDIPFLKIRSAILGVPIPPIFNKKYDVDRHFDVREVLTNFGANQKGTLKQWAIVFGLEPQKDSGKNIHLLSKEDRQAKCLADCRITNHIYQRLKNLY
jgi:predicted PolB exonuclease-like 3'-5' exonuclease